jgi:hypothetical protein
MATNPNRPQYQDTIESTWGQAVADHVIRRYATPAERDSDLAGLTQADLEGQLVAILSPTGTYLQHHRGGVWATLPDIQSGETYVSTDGASNAYITFPRPFGGKPQYFSANAGAGTGGGVTFQANGNGDATKLQLTAWNAAGGAYGAGAVFFLHWLAIYTADVAPVAAARPGPRGDELEEGDS